MEVYTANVGNYDFIRRDGMMQFVFDRCGDPVISSRWYKFHPHKLFPEAEWTVYHDANLFLKVDPKELVDQVKQSGKTVGMFEHPLRNTPEEEAKACIEQGKGSIEDLRDLLKVDPMVGRDKLYCGFLIVRKNVPEVNKQNEHIFQEFKVFRRDQVSMPFYYKDMVHSFGKEKNIKENKYFRRKGHQK